VIPRVDVAAGIVPALPATATYWMPAEDELTAGGIGYFRGVWPLYDVSRPEAAAVLATERSLLEDLDRRAGDAAEFDRLARRLEAREAESAAAGEPDLRGLELGVAGLVYALAAIGCVPAASCRGHVGDGAWSYNPIVFTALDRPHAEWLVPRVRRAKCGFGVGAGREDLLAIHAASVVDTVRLASSILREADVIPPPRRRWGSRSR